MGSVKCILAVILLSFMIFGCATPHSVSQEKLTGIKRIATISLLGDRIEVKHIGSTVFTNKMTYEPVNWKIDTLVKNTINDEISKRTNYQTIDIDFNRDDLTAQEIKNAYDAENQLPKVGIAAKDIEQYLRKIKTSHNIDTLSTKRGDVVSLSNLICGFQSIIFNRSEALIILIALYVPKSHRFLSPLTIKFAPADRAQQAVKLTSVKAISNRSGHCVIPYTSS